MIIKTKKITREEHNRKEFTEVLKKYLLTIN